MITEIDDYNRTIMTERRTLTCCFLSPEAKIEDKIRDTEKSVKLRNKCQAVK